MVVLLVAWASIGHQFCVFCLISTQRRTSEELDWVTRGVKLRGGLEHVSKLKPTRFCCRRLDAAFRRWSSRPISRCHTDHCHVTDTKVSDLVRPSSSLAMVAFRYRFYLRVWLLIDSETRALLYYSHTVHITRIASACYIWGSLLWSSLHVDPHHPLCIALSLFSLCWPQPITASYTSTCSAHFSCPRPLWVPGPNAVWRCQSLASPVFPAYVIT